MPDGSTLLLFTGASLALLAVPGPAVIYVVTRSLGQGRSAGIVSMLGVETGTFAYALAAAAGLTGLIAASEAAFTVVRYAGAAYLAYLGVRKLLERGDADDAVPAARSRLHLDGVLVQILNPKIAVFFLASCPSSSIPRAARSSSRPCCSARSSHCWRSCRTARTSCSPGRSARGCRPAGGRATGSRR
jgi:threonine/homoserine/homoserine lactone efflux protein